MYLVKIKRRKLNIRIRIKLINWGLFNLLLHVVAISMLLDRFSIVCIVMICNFD